MMQICRIRKPIEEAKRLPPLSRSPSWRQACTNQYWRQLISLEQVLAGQSLKRLSMPPR
jgi:hypothetical protein